LLQTDLAPAIWIFRPRSLDRIEYHISLTGGPNGGGSGFVEDEFTLCPMKLNDEIRFTLGVGIADDLPEFRMRVVCRSGEVEWELIQSLPPPCGTVA